MGKDPRIPNTTRYRYRSSACGYRTAAIVYPAQEQRPVTDCTMANADREMVDGLRVRTDVNAPGLGNPAGGPQNAARASDAWAGGGKPSPAEGTATGRPRLAREASRVRERDASAG